MIDRVFEGARVKEQGYNPSLAILRLSKTYSDGRLENACELALSRGIKSPRYHHLSAILKANQDEQYQEEKETKEPLKDSSLRLSSAERITTAGGVTAMLNDETKRKLRLMNIGEFISAVDLQEDDPQLLALPFSERFQMAVDHVYQDKYNMKSERLIKQAKLRFPAADIHDIYYGEKRRLNRNLMGEIATCQYIEKSTSLIFQGFSSTGKTWLGCAYAKEAS